MNRIGAHLSVAGGMEKLFEHMKYLNLSCAQCFTKNNRQWHFESFTEDEIQRFKNAQKADHIDHKNIVSHACYLINICGAPEVHQKSVMALEAELIRCAQLNIPWTVIHPGSSSGSKKEVLVHLADSIIDIFDKVENTTGIALENSAGQGNSLPHTLEDLAFVYQMIAKKHPHRIGVCIDTCHAWASGYNLNEGYEDFCKNLIDLIGAENIPVLHLNDSKKECGSRVDRHEHLGKGEINKKVFEMIMKDKRFKKSIKILETPYDTFDDLKDDIHFLQSF